MSTKVLFFDMGETLCHQSPATPKILGEFLARHAIERSDRQLRMAYLGAMTLFSRWAMNTDIAERTAEGREAMVDGFYGVMMNALGLDHQPKLIAEARAMVLEQRQNFRNVLFPDVLPALGALRQRGLRLGIISNWDDTLTDVVHDLGLTRYFEAVIGSDTMGLEKPNRVIFEAALRRMGVSAEEAWHVGDMYYMDVLGARGAGLRPILVDRHKLQLGIDCPRIESLTELTTVLEEA